jgi:catechol 2,3-dioxygenase
MQQKMYDRDQIKAGGIVMRYKIKRTGHLVLRVKDLERSRRFFTEIMGLPVVANNDNRMLFFSSDVGDNHHMLAIRQAEEGAPLPAENQVGMAHVAYELGSFAELQEAYKVIKERGVKIRHAVFHGVTKSVYFYDPDGNMFELYCNVPPEEYRKSTTNPYGAGKDIDDELRGAVPQRPGTVAP